MRVCLWREGGADTATVSHRAAESPGVAAAFPLGCSCSLVALDSKSCVGFVHADSLLGKDPFLYRTFALREVNQLLHDRCGEACSALLRVAGVTRTETQSPVRIRSDRIGAPRSLSAARVSMVAVSVMVPRATPMLVRVVFLLLASTQIVLRKW